MHCQPGHVHHLHATASKVRVAAVDSSHAAAPVPRQERRERASESKGHSRPSRRREDVLAAPGRRPDSPEAEQRAVNPPRASAPTSNLRNTTHVQSGQREKAAHNGRHRRAGSRRSAKPGSEPARGAAASAAPGTAASQAAEARQLHAWSLFSLPPSQAAAGPSAQRGAAAPEAVRAALAAVRQQFQGVHGDQLAALGLKWADELWLAVEEYQQQPKAQHSSCGAAGPRGNLSHNASMPRAWWQQVHVGRQEAALTNLTALGLEVLHRLGVPAPQHTPDEHIQQPISEPQQSTTSSSLPAPVPAQTPAASQPHGRCRVDSIPLAVTLRMSAAATTNQAQPAYLPPPDAPKTDRPSAEQLSRGVTRQQHADVAWAVTHLWCAHTVVSRPQPAASQSQPVPSQHSPDTPAAATATCTTHQAAHAAPGTQEQPVHALRDALVQQHGQVMVVLQHALGVPFCVLPLVLPGLEVAAMEREVQLKRDVIWLDNGTRAVEESRLTGWQSDIGATFKYNGKEMQPESGGLSPLVAQVRDVLLHHIREHYDSVLINLYPDGRCGMRYHVDPLYGCWTPETSVVSVGHTRKFVFRSMEDHSIRWSYSVRNGDAVVMFGDCQDRLQHSVITESLETTVGPRISLVYKQRIPGTL